MNNFKQFNEAKKEAETGYKANVKHAIEDINKLIEYGRKLEMDNKLLNPLLDAIKSIHTAEDAIAKAYEASITPEEPEEEPEVVIPDEPKQW